MPPRIAYEVPGRKYSDIYTSIEDDVVSTISHRVRAICGCQSRCHGQPNEIAAKTYRMHMNDERRLLAQISANTPMPPEPSQIVDVISNVPTATNTEVNVNLEGSAIGQSSVQEAEDTGLSWADADPSWASWDDGEEYNPYRNSQAAFPIEAIELSVLNHLEEAARVVVNETDGQPVHQDLGTSHTTFLFDETFEGQDAGEFGFDADPGASSAPEFRQAEIVERNGTTLGPNWFPYRRLDPDRLPSREAENRPSMTLPFLQRSVYTMAINMAGTYNAPVRAVNHYLQTEWVHLKYAFDMGVKWARENPVNPDEPTDISYDTIFQEPTAASLRTAEKHLSPAQSIIKHPVCPNKTCHEVFYEVTSPDEFSNVPDQCPACNTDLRTNTGDDLFLIYPRTSLTEELQRLVNTEGIWELITSTAKFKNADTRRDAVAHPGLTIYRNQFDGTVFDKNEKWANDHKSDADAHVIHINVGYDCYNPNSMQTSAAQSVGILCAHLANLPQRLRGHTSMLMVLGVTPARNEPKGCNLWKHMLPFVSQVEDTIRKPLKLYPPGHPEGVTVVVVIDALSCDRPAAINMSGAAHQSNKEDFCTRCHAGMSKLLTQQNFPRRDYQEERRRIYDQVLSVDAALDAAQARHEAAEIVRVAARETQIQDYTEEHGESRQSRRPQSLQVRPFSRADLVRFNAHHYQQKGNVTAFSVLPYFCGVTSAVIDPMHCFLIGICKAYYLQTLVNGKYLSEAQGEAVQDGIETPLGKRRKIDHQVLTAGNLDALHRLLAKIVWPFGVTALANDFLSPNAGTGSAAHWKIFSELVVPLVFPVLFAKHGDNDGTRRKSRSLTNARMTNAELQAIMDLSHITTLALRPTISCVQLDILQEQVDRFVETALKLHPGLVKVFNFHSCRHIVEDIRSFGPSRSFWCMVSERLNKEFKNQNRNGRQGQAEVLALNAFLRSSKIPQLMDQLAASAKNDRLEKDTSDRLCAIQNKFVKDQTAAGIDSLTQELQRDHGMVMEDSVAVMSSLVDVNYSLSGDARGRALNSAELEVLVAAALQCLGIRTRRHDDCRPSTSSTCVISGLNVTLRAQLKCDRRVFRNVGVDPLNNTSVDFLKTQSKCMFSIVKDNDIFKGRNISGGAYLLINLVTIKCVSQDGSSTLDHDFAIVRPLIELFHDPYGWHEHWSAANVRLYQADTLGPLKAMPLSHATIGDWRPVIWMPVDSHPHNGSSKEAIALKPLDNM